MDELPLDGKAAGQGQDGAADGKHQGAQMQRYMMMPADPSQMSQPFMHAPMHMGMSIPPGHQDPSNSPVQPSRINQVRACISQKSHNCAQCSKQFVSRSKLARHMLVHTKQKPWMCAVCGTRFTQKSALTVHFKRHAFFETPCFEFCNHSSYFL